MQMVWKYRDFRPISCFISKTTKTKVTVTMERQLELVCDLPNGAISNDLEWLLTQNPKFQGHDIIQFQITRKWHNIELHYKWRTDSRPKSYMVYQTASLSMTLQWTTPSLVFKVTPLFNAEYPRNSTRYRHSYSEILIATYALVKGVIMNDLEWLSEISNDTKYRVVSLQQLNFLSMQVFRITTTTNVLHVLV